MTKKQKIWGGIFLCMFLIPEILWGAVLSVLHLLLNLSLRPLFSTTYFVNESLFFAYLIIIIEVVGLIGLMTIFFQLGKNQKVFTIFGFLLVLPIVLLGLVFALSLSLNNISY